MPRRATGSGRQPGRHQPVRLAGHGLGRGPAHVEFRSVDKAGNAEATRSVQFGIDVPDPGFPVIEAFADPATGAAPLETRFSASGYGPDGGTITYRWEFADGAFN